ncbi:hypothetical protein Efla_004067 [Eimeria flavescens]
MPVDPLLACKLRAKSSSSASADMAELAACSSCFGGFPIHGRRSPSSPPLGGVYGHLGSVCGEAPEPRPLPVRSFEKHNSAGVLHCCRTLLREGGDPSNSEKLRLQLSSVGERFAGFKLSIAEDSRRRRFFEEERYRQIHGALKALERGVAAEMKKRGDANKLLQRVAETMAAEMLERLQQRIAKHIGHLTAVLDHLITRCEKLEQGLTSLKGEDAENLSRQTAELMTRCRSLRIAFEGEVRARTEREDVAIEKLETLLKNLDLKIDSEIATRHQQLSTMKRDIEILLRGDQPHEQFHLFVKEELAELREGLLAATRIREQADDEILQAITDYTVALQRGLQNVGGLSGGS